VLIKIRVMKLNW